MKKILIGFIALFAITALNVAPVEDVQAQEIEHVKAWRLKWAACPDGTIYRKCVYTLDPGSSCDPNNMPAFPC